jgi:hypothetical protein
MSKHKRRERRETLYIQDYTSGRWDDTLPAMVAQLAALLPAGAPKLVYQRRAPTDCGGLPAPGKSDRIAICSNPTPTPPFAGTTTMGRHSLITLYDAAVSEGSYEREVACHELMHALAHVPDAYNTNPDSCVYGHLDHPGGADIQMLREHYRKKDRR